MPQAGNPVVSEQASSSRIDSEKLSFSEARQSWFKQLAFHLIRTSQTENHQKINSVYAILKLLLQDKLADKINEKLIKQFVQDQIEIQNYIKLFQYFSPLHQLYFPLVSKVAEWEQSLLARLKNPKENNEGELCNDLIVSLAAIIDINLDEEVIADDVENRDFFLQAIEDFRKAIRDILEVIRAEMVTHQAAGIQWLTVAKMHQLTADVQAALENALKAQKQKVFEKIKTQELQRSEARAAAVLTEHPEVDSSLEKKAMEQATQQNYFEEQLRVVTEEIELDLKPFHPGGDIAFVSEHMLELYQQQLRYLARIREVACERSVQTAADCEYQSTEPYRMTLSLEHEHLIRIAMAYFAELRFYFLRAPTHAGLHIRLRERYGVIATSLRDVHQEMIRIVKEVSVEEGYAILFPTRDQTIAFDQMKQELKKKYGKDWPEGVKKCYSQNFEAYCETLREEYHNLLSGSSSSQSEISSQNYWVSLNLFYENLLTWLFERSTLFTDLSSALTATEERKFEEQKRHYLSLLLTSEGHFSTDDHSLLPAFQEILGADSLTALFNVAEQHVHEGKVEVKDFVAWKEWALVQHQKYVPEIVTHLLTQTKRIFEKIKVIEKELSDWQKKLWVRPTILSDLWALAVRCFKERNTSEEALLAWKEAVLALQENFAPPILKDLVALMRRHFDGESVAESEVIRWKKSVLDLQAMFGQSDFLAALLDLADQGFSSQTTPSRKDFIAWRESLLAVQRAFGNFFLSDDLSILLARHSAKRSVPQEGDDSTMAEAVFVCQENFWPEALHKVLAVADAYFTENPVQEEKLDALEREISALEGEFCQFVALHELLDIVKINFHRRPPSIMVDDAIDLPQETLTAQQKASKSARFSLNHLIGSTEAYIEKIRALKTEWVAWQAEIASKREKLPAPFLQKLLSLTETQLVEIDLIEGELIKGIQQMRIHADHIEPKSLQDWAAFVAAQWEKVKLTEKAFSLWKDEVVFKQKLQGEAVLIVPQLLGLAEEHRKKIEAIEKERDAEASFWHADVLDSYAALTQVHFFNTVASLEKTQLDAIGIVEEDFVSWKEQLSRTPTVFQSTDFLNRLHGLSECFLMRINEQKTDLLDWEKSVVNAQNTSDKSILLEDLLALVRRCNNAPAYQVNQEYSAWEEAVTMAQEAAFEFAQFSGKVGGPSSGQSKVLEKLRELAQEIKGKQLRGQTISQKHRDFQAILKQQPAFAQFKANIAYLLLKKVRAEWLWILSDRQLPMLREEDLVDEQGNNLFMHIRDTRNPALESCFILLYFTNAPLMDESSYLQLQPVVQGKSLTPLGVVKRLTEFKETHARQWQNPTPDILTMKKAYDQLCTVSLPELEGLSSGSLFAKSVHRLVGEMEIYFLHQTQRIHPEMAQLLWLLEKDPKRLTGAQAKKTLLISIFPTSAQEIGYAFWPLVGARVDDIIQPQAKAGDEYGGSGSFRPLLRTLLENQREKTQSTLKRYEVPLLRYMKDSGHLEDFWIRMLRLFDDIKKLLPRLLDEIHVSVSQGNDESIQALLGKLRDMLKHLWEVLHTRQLDRDSGARRLKGWLEKIDTLMKKYAQAGDDYARKPDSAMIQATAQQLRASTEQGLESCLSIIATKIQMGREEVSQREAKVAREEAQAAEKMNAAKEKMTEVDKKMAELEKRERSMVLNELEVEIRRLEINLEKAENFTQRAALESVWCRLQEELATIRARFTANVEHGADRDVLAKLDALEALLMKMESVWREAPVTSVFSAAGPSGLAPG